MPKALSVYIEREVSEWLKEHAWKVCKRESVSRVRISSSLQVIVRVSGYFN